MRIHSPETRALASLSCETQLWLLLRWPQLTFHAYSVVLWHMS